MGWLVQEGVLEASPMEVIAAPRIPSRARTRNRFMPYGYGFMELREEATDEER
jgi:hypothetical protein